MKSLKYIYLLCVTALFAGCTTQNLYDSGVSTPYHDCSIMEYLRGDLYNWELTVAMIERAGLTDLFEGTDPDYKEITFFAFPSFSVLRYQAAGINSNIMIIISLMAAEFIISQYSTLIRFPCRLQQCLRRHIKCRN